MLGTSVCRYYRAMARFYAHFARLPLSQCPGWSALSLLQWMARVTSWQPSKKDRTLACSLNGSLLATLGWPIWTSVRTGGFLWTLVVVHRQYFQPWCGSVWGKSECIYILSLLLVRPRAEIAFQPSTFGLSFAKPIVTSKLVARHNEIKFPVEMECNSPSGNGGRNTLFEKTKSRKELVRETNKG